MNFVAIFCCCNIEAVWTGGGGGGGGEGEDAEGVNIRSDINIFIPTLQSPFSEHRDLEQ